MFSTSRLFFGCAAVLSALQSVSAHGYVTQFTIDGKKYTGLAPGSTSTDSTTRPVTENGPVTDVTSKDMWCGLGSVPVSQLASAKPGSSLEILVSFSFPYS